jgi:AcrR family transcriptional regulator
MSREIKKQASRKLILRTAHRQLYDQGYAALTMRGVAAEADLALGTLYNYFPGKSELLAAVLMESMEQGLGDFFQHYSQEFDNLGFQEFCILLFSKAEAMYLDIPKTLWRELLAASYAGRFPSSNHLWVLQKDLFALLDSAIERWKAKGMIGRSVQKDLLTQQIFSIFFLRFLQYLNSDLTTQEFQQPFAQMLSHLYLGISHDR